MTSIDETCGGAPIRVAIADDQDLVRKGFRLILSSFPGIEVVGEAVDGADAVALARRMRPDVLLMDIRMPRKDGIEACRELAGDPDTADVAVLILTTFDIDEYVYDALAAGASGFLLKDVDPDDLAQAIRVVHEAMHSFSRRLRAVWSKPTPRRAARRASMARASLILPTESARFSPWSARACPMMKSLLNW